MRRLSRSLEAILLCVVASCAIAPSDDEVKMAITDFFGRRHYKVVALTIGKREGIPLAEKTYMGTPGFVVEVHTITLEAQQDKGSDIKKGMRFTFSNARMRMRQDSENKSLWHVSIISGIAVH